jgi:hypothetical protein
MHILDHTLTPDEMKLFKPTAKGITMRRRVILIDVVITAFVVYTMLYHTDSVVWYGWIMGFYALMLCAAGLIYLVHGWYLFDDKSVPKTTRDSLLSDMNISLDWPYGRYAIARTIKTFISAVVLICVSYHVGWYNFCILVSLCYIATMVVHSRRGLVTLKLLNDRKGP